MSLDNDKLKDSFSSEAELLLNTRKAAKLLKASPTDRPESISISPKSKEIFIALTNNRDKKEILLVPFLKLKKLIMIMVL